MEAEAPDYRQVFNAIVPVVERYGVEKLDTRTLLKRGSGATLEPLPIPRFTPQRFAFRWSF
jgi:hypothetical protein